MIYADMSSQFPKGIPSIWFVHRREYLETYSDSLNDLHQRLTRVSGVNNLISIKQAVELLNELYGCAEAMVDTLANYEEPLASHYNSYKLKELRRIQELSLSTSSQLSVVAKQIGWGMPFDRQLTQAKRNLYPLMKLVDETLSWLKQAS
ncbi:MAG: hypothetical protein WHV66_01385 [Anaerolineales bacterium]